MMIQSFMAKALIKAGGAKPRTAAVVDSRPRSGKRNQGTVCECGYKKLSGEEACPACRAIEKRRHAAEDRAAYYRRHGPLAKYAALFTAASCGRMTTPHHGC